MRALSRFAIVPKSSVMGLILRTVCNSDLVRATTLRTPRTLAGQLGQGTERACSAGAESEPSADLAPVLGPVCWQPALSNTHPSANNFSLLSFSPVSDLNSHLPPPSPLLVLGPKTDKTEGKNFASFVISSLQQLRSTGCVGRSEVVARRGFVIESGGWKGLEKSFRPVPGIMFCKTVEPKTPRWTLIAGGRK